MTLGHQKYKVTFFFGFLFVFLFSKKLKPNLLRKPQNVLSLTAFYQIGSSLQNANRQLNTRLVSAMHAIFTLRAGIPYFIDRLITACAPLL